jgi:DNA-binding LacI/PurR family transcriptional regulator
VTERVLNVARELNYVPNHIARSLVTKKTMAIGLTIPHGNVFFSTFHNQFINGVVLEASTFGYRVLLDMIPSQEVKTPSLASYPIDGAIVLGPEEEDERIDLLHRNRIPFVTVGRIINSNVRDVPTVNNDNDRIIRDICGYLIDLGHSDILFLNAGLRKTVSLERTEAFIQALREHQIEPQSHMIRYMPDIHSGEYMNYGYDETVHALIALGKKVTAIIADDDRTAFSAMNAIKGLGLDVPGDISIFVICGDLAMMSQATPSLTGMDLQPSELGAQSVKLLMHELAVLEGVYDDRWIVDSKIIERNSCASVGGRVD